ncbi:MAG: TonB-dependent receptor [Candidatus Eisenbacteria bacterium]
MISRRAESHAWTSHEAGDLVVSFFPVLGLLAVLASGDSVFTLPTVDVRDARPIDDPALRRAPGFARSYDVTPAYGRLGTVSDLLARGVGVHVRQFGGLGAFSAVSIRGSSSAQVAYYLDGAPLNQAQYGVVNAADLPIEALSRIEVYRGGAPLAFDAPGGGVVELVTRDTPGGWMRADVGGGSFGTRKLDAAVGATRARTTLMAVGQHLSSDGDFRYLDDNSTNANSADDTLRTRANNAFDSYALTARVAQAIGGTRVSLTHDRLDKRQGVPGTGANTALLARLRTDRDVSMLRAAFEAWPLAPALSAFYARQRDRFSDPERELSGSRQDNDDRTVRYGGRGEAALALPGALGGTHRLALLGEGRRERYTPRVNLPSPRVLPISQRELAVYGAEDRWSPGDGRFGVTVQARRELTFDAFPAGPAYPGALPSPAAHRTTRLTRWTVGARVELASSGAGTLAFKASLARLARTPTLEELFGNRGGVHGNRDARPERVLTRDAGLTGAWALAAGRAGRPRTLEAQVSVYRSDADDLLVFLQNSARTSVAQNVAAARLEGLELATRAAWAWGLSADLSWTRQWTRDQGQVAYWRGKDLPGRPRDEASLGLSLERGPVRGFGELHAVSSFHLDRYNQITVPGRALVDLGASYAFARLRTDVVVECRNVGDARAQDFGGYPLPGRSWALGLRFHLDRKADLP